MKKYFPLFWVFYLLCAFSAHAGEGRYTIPLSHEEGKGGHSASSLLYRATATSHLPSTE